MPELPLSMLLPAPAPACANRRLLLFAMRRLAIGGLQDAHAAQAMIGAFGLSFRRPLILLRALMAEVSRAAERKIAIAPCCCVRMTGAESVLVAAVADANADPHATHARLAAMLGVRSALGTLSSAQAVGQAFADCGLPLSAEQPAEE